MKAEKVITTRLDEELFNKISEIAKRERVSKGSIIKRALDFYLKQDTKRTEELPEIAQKLHEIDRRYYEVVNRLNIISRRLENLQKTRG